MPTTWASTSVFSPDRPAKRPVGARRILPSSRAGPNPLGENQSLSSPPLEPRGLLLSVMRQKVGKERSQEGCAPLANPRFFRTAPPGEGSARRPHPSRLCKTPVGVPSGTDRAGDAKHRDKLTSKLSRDLPMAADATPRRRDATFAPLTCAAAGVSRETAPSLPLLRPTLYSDRAPRRFILFRQERNSESLLRRGARGELSR